jgi:2-polyprenyl-3-methyl-5-hydroxy-6-metoxy-1,4-benzoquinol methylase
VEPQIIDQLLRLNSAFYEHFGDAFAQTRGVQQPGLQRLVLNLPAIGSLLDVGCGNGRLAHVFDQAGLSLTYLGVDASESLLVAARAQLSRLQHVHASFLHADVTRPGWEWALSQRSFPGIALLAVLHHVPSWQLRRSLLVTLRGLLADDGVLAVSTWQFLSSERLRRKIVSWSAIGLEPNAVEPSDYLLDWRRGGHGLRYCRAIDQAELTNLAAETGFRLRTAFLADNGLNLFAILEHAANHQ